jgi:hypothetical protein
LARVIYTTCGTSLITSNCWLDVSKGPAVLDPSLSLVDKDKYRHDYTRYIYKFMKKGSRQGVDELSAKFDSDIWSNPSTLRKLPAELASLRAIKSFCDGNSKIGSLNGNDRLILVQADNDEAEFCARAIHKVLKDYKIMGDLAIHPLWRIDGLDPSRPKDFEPALESLWLQLTSKVFAQGDMLFLNITGGYKATIMLFACLGYARGKEDTYIFYLNEEAEEEVLVMCFDKHKTSNGGFRSVVIGRIDPRTGQYFGHSPIFTQF